MNCVLKRRRTDWSTPLAFRAGAATLLVLCLGFVLVPALWTHEPNDIVANPYLGPSQSFPFGTDSVGRDLFVRVFQAGRLDISIALLIVVPSLFIGTVLGISAALEDKLFGQLVMRVVDAVVAFPFIVLILVLIVVIGPSASLGPLPAGTTPVVVGMLLVDWAIYARLARGETLSLRSRDYIVAAKMLGFSRRRIIFRHLLPNVWRVTATYAVSDVILAIIAVASLSFLGAGVQAPTAEWGAIMFEGRGVIGSAWWITVIPGCFLALLGLTLNGISDSMLERDHRD